MTPRDVALVQHTFQRLTPIAAQTAALFYARLFELEPTLRPMFRGSLQDQGQRLMQMLGMTVRSLADLDVLMPAVRQLGARHVGYGVRDEHYAAAGIAWLWTLERVLGTEFTPAVKQAWTHTYLTLSNAMMEGAHALAPAA